MRRTRARGVADWIGRTRLCGEGSDGLHPSLVATGPRSGLAHSVTIDRSERRQRALPGFLALDVLARGVRSGARLAVHYLVRELSGSCSSLDGRDTPRSGADGAQGAW
jgi:hypothetical protein